MFVGDREWRFENLSESHKNTLKMTFGCMDGNQQTWLKRWIPPRVSKRHSWVSETTADLQEELANADIQILTSETFVDDPTAQVKSLSVKGN